LFRARAAEVRRFFQDYRDNLEKDTEVTATERQHRLTSLAALEAAVDLFRHSLYYHCIIEFPNSSFFVIQSILNSINIDYRYIPI